MTAVAAAAAAVLVPASTVQATARGATTARAGVVAPAAAPAAARVPIPGKPGTYRKIAPEHYTPPRGPKFNNPYGSQRSRRTLLRHVIRSINSSAGYRLPKGRDPRTKKRVTCPGQPKYYPSTIRIALYSIADRDFVDALIAAHRRCVSVRLLMNSHLNARNSLSWRRLVNHIGSNRGRRSFVRRCSNGCLGTNVLHTKFYLFSRSGAARRTVMVGSSNMTSNAVRVQWNDLFTVNGNEPLFNRYTDVFNRMARDRSHNGPWTYRTGPYVSTFYPFRQANRTTDKTMKALRTIRCSGARGGAGLNGHTVLYIVMHSWHGTRGLYLAKRVRGMYNRGCYVRILYSFMGHGTYKLLTRKTGSRMVARRVLFAGPEGFAAKYSHMKMFAASGYVSGDRSNWVTWTGSNNWADRSRKADEVTIRVPGRAAYRRYVDHWNVMRNRRSTGVWAIYPELGGGGRVARLIAAQVPVTIQAVPRARCRSTTARLPMNPTPNTAHSQSSPDRASGLRYTASEGQRCEHREDERATPGEVAAVAGADEHAVQHEHDAGDRLEHGRHHEHRPQQVAHGRILGEQPAEEGRRGGQGYAGDDAGERPPLHHPSGDVSGPLDVPGAQVASGDGLRGDGDRVEGEREERPDGQRELMGGHRRGPERRGAVRRDQEGHPQRQRAHHQRHPGLCRPAYACEVRTQRRSLPPGRVDHHCDQCRGRAQLGDVGADRRARDAQVQAEDECVVEGDVREVADHRHDERGASVLQPAQHPRPGEHHEQRHHAEEGPAKVGRSVLRD